MGKRLDDLFSPEKLRRNWNAAHIPEDDLRDHQQPPTEKGRAVAILSQLKNTINRRFSRKVPPAVQLMLEALQGLIEKRFPSPPASMLETDEKNALNSAIHDLLYQIEDLVEAFEIGSIPSR